MVLEPLFYMVRVKLNLSFTEIDVSNNFKCFLHYYEVLYQLKQRFRIDTQGEYLWINFSLKT